MSETIEKNDKLSEKNNVNEENVQKQDEPQKERKSYESSKYSHTQP